MTNIFDNIPQNAPEEIFETLLTSPPIRIERIVSNGQATPEGDWYDQNEHEWILVLQGNAALRFENEAEDRVLASGDYLNIPAHVRHRVQWTSADEPTIWLAIFYMECNCEPDA
jgi:cupin 2 domain-containing protein